MSRNLKMTTGGEKPLPSASPLALAFGLSFGDLYARDGLLKIDSAFMAHLHESDAALAGQLDAVRGQPDALAAKESSDLMLAVAPHVDDFVGRLFGISAEVATAAEAHNALAPLFQCKRLFVQRIALKKHKPDVAAAYDGVTLAADLEARIGGPLSEMAFARAVNGWMEDEAAHAEPLDIAARYSAWAVHTPQGRARHADDVLFKAPARQDAMALVPLQTTDRHGAAHLEIDGHLRDRAGFDLTDQGCDLRGGLDEANYCIFCHHQGFDSCSKGMRDRKTGDVQESALGRRQNGCPLEEKVSEMNEAKAGGHLIAALACITVDNPMCAGTGHRICNDCMVACIYQRQRVQPVDIPQVETRTLKDILDLPWGFEIYGLLTRWNPLDFRRPVPRPDSGKKVLVVGLGPAGYTLAHHLMNDGHTVVAVDGLKIEPLDAAVSGVDAMGQRVPFHPVRDVAELREPLGSRVMAGFGGVAEYGITVRWDKNFLKMIRLLLERRTQFAMFGGVRFGGTITEDMAFSMGFDHVALCMGAGRPTIIKMPQGLARGVRQASDFLMGLQLTGAAREKSIANLQLRLPVAVIGGGLTGVDACTEAMAYYPVQVLKFLDRHEALVAERGAAAVEARWTDEDREIATEFLAHGRAVRAEKAAADAEGRAPRLRALVESWGGVTLVYRRKLTDSPAYRNNHEEVAKALEEGIRVAEELSPLAVEVDRWGAAEGLTVRKADGTELTLPARAIIVAAGTVPNVTLAREYPGTLELDGKYFQAVDESGAPVTPEAGNTKPAAIHVLREVRADGGAVSFFGDQHPSWAGNVVSAMASAKQGYPVVSRLLAGKAPGPVSGPDLIARLNTVLRPVVHSVRRLTPTIVEVVVKAPLAARMFQPGQFYRLQNFEAHCPVAPDGTLLAMEGLALTGAWTDVEQGLLGMIVLEMGGSSDLCMALKPGEPVVVMGPTGEPTEIPEGETVLLAGGGLGNAVLFSIGAALRAAGSKVVYFAGYKSLRDRFHVENIEAAADVVVWCCDEAPGFTASRPQDRTFAGNIVAAMAAYGRGDLGPAAIPLSAADRIIAIGSDRMMKAVGEARGGVLKPFLKAGGVRGIGSINSPMQCMMKEICAQCLQPHTDPRTGETFVVFSCFNQDQSLDTVDFQALHERLGQNSLQEKQTAQWIDRAMTATGVR